MYSVSQLRLQVCCCISVLSVCGSVFTLMAIAIERWVRQGETFCFWDCQIWRQSVGGVPARVYCVAQSIIYPN